MTKHILLIFALSFVAVLSSCESQETKESRLGLDLASRKLNLFGEQFIQSKTEEGQQSKLTLSTFYGKYTDKLDEVSESIAILPNEEKHKVARDNLKLSVVLLKTFVDTRRALINNVTEASSSYQEYIEQGRKKDEYWNDYRNSGYRYDFYKEYSHNALIKELDEMMSFIDAKYAASDLVDSLFVLNDSIDMVINSYNLNVSESKLIDSVIINPLVDSTGLDWLISAEVSISKLSISDDD